MFWDASKCSVSGVLQKAMMMMVARVLDSCSSTEPFEVRTGVKQGCVIAPTLFSIFISTVSQLIKDKLLEGVAVIYRLDKVLFDLKRLRAKIKTSTTSVVELQCADDNCVCATSEENLQTILDAFG